MLIKIRFDHTAAGLPQLISKRHNKLNSRKVIAIACQQALRGALAAGRENEGELATTSLEFKFPLQFPYGSP